MAGTRPVDVFLVNRDLADPSAEGVVGLVVRVVAPGDSLPDAMRAACDRAHELAGDWQHGLPDGASATIPMPGDDWALVYPLAAVGDAARVVRLGPGELFTDWPEGTP